MPTYPSDYTNYFDPDKGYFKSLHFPGKGLAAYEVNEIFDIQNYKIKQVADLILKEGDIVEGGLPVINSVDGVVIIQAGKIYLQGELVSFGETSFDIPVDEEIKLGVFVEDLIVSGGEEESETEDPELLDPSRIITGKVYATSDQETSKRLKKKLTWGYKDSEGNPSVDSGSFYEIYTLDNGELILLPITPSKSGIVEEIARYDRDVNGSYVVEGLVVNYDYSDQTREHYYFDITSGIANINGYKKSRNYTNDFEVELDPDLEEVETDPYNITLSSVEETVRITRGSGDEDTILRSDITDVGAVTSLDGSVTYVLDTDYSIDGDTITWLGEDEPDEGDIYLVAVVFDGATVEVDRGPIDNISSISAELEVTETVTRGVVSGGADSLDNSSVTEIVSITQGLTTFVEGTDYILTGSTVNWSPGGAEPAASSTYTVVYHYRKVIEANAESINNTTYSICHQGADGDLVDGSQVLTTYEYRLKRIDLIEILQDGSIIRTKGVSHRTNPNVPSGNPNALSLAKVEFDWVNDPTVKNISNKVIKQEDLHTMKSRDIALSTLVAEMQLQINAILKGASDAGIFTDSFSDKSRRDEGKEQSMLFVQDLITVPLDITQGDLDNAANTAAQTLVYTTEVIIDQSQRTARMKINPYASYEIPKPITVDVAIDHQVEDFTEQTMVQASNPAVTSWIKEDSYPAIVNNSNGTITPAPAPITPTAAINQRAYGDIIRIGRPEPTPDDVSKPPKGRAQPIQISLPTTKPLGNFQNGIINIGGKTINLNTGKVVKK